jgi:hypothetical protein
VWILVEFIVIAFFLLKLLEKRQLAAESDFFLGMKRREEEF